MKQPALQGLRSPGEAGAGRGWRELSKPRSSPVAGPACRCPLDPWLGISTCWMRDRSEDISYKSVKTAHARPRRTWRSGLGLRSTLPEGSRSVASFRKAPAFRHPDPGGGRRAGTWLCFLAAKVKREIGRGALGLSTSLQAARTSVSRDEAFSGADDPEQGVPESLLQGRGEQKGQPAAQPPGPVFLQEMSSL